MDSILIILSLISTGIGTVALYIFIFRAFSAKNNTNGKSTIRMRLIHEKTVSFVIALIVSEIMGIFFLFLAGSFKNIIMTFNGFAFLVASCICSFIIIVNAIRDDQIDLRFWIGVQSIILVVSIGLIRLSIVVPDEETLERLGGHISLLLQFISVVYFATTVVAVFLILWDSMKNEIQFNRHYLIWTIILGIGFGTGLFIISNNWRALL